MGREASCSITFGGQSGAAKLLLEATEIILRGDIRAKIPRDQVTGFAVDDQDLVITTTQGPLRATLGAKDATAWVKALAKPPPTLADKLGIKPETGVLVIGGLTDAALIAALAGHPRAESPTVLLAELLDQPGFDRALAVCNAHPNAAFWGVTRKGKSALPDQTLRTQMRAAGYIDTKSCAVSDAFTATRYSRRSA